MARTPQTVVSRAVVTAVGMAIQGVARFAYTWVVANFVGAEEVGDVNALLSVAVFAALVWPQPAGIGATRYLPIPGEAAPAMTVIRRSFILSLVVLAPAGGVVAWMLVADPWAAFGTAILVASYGGYVFTRGALLGRDEIIRATVWDAISSAVSLGALVLVVLGRVHWALILPLAAGYLAFTLLNWPREQDPEPPADLRREVLLFTRDSAVAAIASGGLLSLTMVLVRAWDAPNAGYFAVALSLATPANLLALALNQILVPHFSRIRNLAPEVIRASHRKIFLVSSVGFVVVFGLLIWITPFLLRPPFFREEYIAGADVMRALLLIVLVMSLMAVPTSYLAAVGYQRLHATVWLVAFVIGAIVLFVATPILGQWGAVIGYAVGACLGSFTLIGYGLALSPRVSAAAPGPTAPAPPTAP
ncbi:MAG: hypothetical protein Q4G64_09840, partial [bacterium]|nr:hypothetical protein [bacterium]